MNKKLIAVAVAGAFAAPAVALAQSSTVQIYGKLTYEYARTNEGAGLLKTDVSDTPGGSSIGFKGEEKLGGGLSAWFQCESSADVRGLDQTGLCTRNSAVGFKGGFGNIHFGRWDTPMKRALNVGTVGAQETGPLGASFLPFGGSGGTDATAANNRARWKRREVAVSYYETPMFGGFQGLFAFTPGDAATSTPVGTVSPKPRVVSLAGTYKAGPLGIGLGFERHNDFSAGGDDQAWGISGSYKIGKAVEIGATYLDAKYETSATAETKKKTWTLGVEWNISGPHSIEAQYANAGDTKGNGTGIQTTSRQGFAAPGADTGGSQYSLAYAHAFSKRTEGRLIYTRINNDANAFYALGSASPNVGEDMSAYGFYLSHKF